MMRSSVLILLALGMAAGEAAPPPQPAQQPPAITPAPRVFLGVIMEEGGGFDGPPSVHVTRVVPGSTSEKLGLQADDRIVSVNGQPGNTIAAFRTATAALKPGDALRLEILRGGKAQTLQGQAEAPPRPRDVLADAERIKGDTAELRDIAERARMRGDLEELLRLLREFETGLPAVASEYKRLYPKGTFDIQIHINIRSDPVAPEQVPLKPAAVPESSPKTEMPKP